MEEVITNAESSEVIVDISLNANVRSTEPESKMFEAMESDENGVQEGQGMRGTDSCRKGIFSPVRTSSQ
jgi:hypothetical protein